MICDKCGSEMKRVGMWSFTCPRCFQYFSIEDTAHTAEDH